MIRPILTITFGSFILSFAIGGILGIFNVDQPSVLGIITLFAASAIAGGRFVKKQGRSMDPGERIYCAVISSLAILFLIVLVVAAAVIAIGDLSISPSSIAREFGMESGVLLTVAVIGFVVYMLISTLIAYLGMGFGQKAQAKQATSLIKDTFE